MLHEKDTVDRMLKAHQLTARHPELINVIYECEHGGNKIKHHFSYTLPYSVMLLCYKCHVQEHFDFNPHYRVQKRNDIKKKVAWLADFFGGYKKLSENIGISYSYVSNMAGGTIPGKRLR